MKKYIVGFLIGALIFTGIGVFADDILEATGIKYKKKTVQDALNELYIKANAKDVGAQKICKFVDGTYGSFGEIGSKYECDPGDGVTRNFYLLALDNDRVDLIMDRNITQGSSATTMTWNNAMKYIGNNNLKTTWSNVLDVDLPKAQAIVNAVGRSSWIAVDSGATWWCFASKTQDSQSYPYCNTETTKAYNWLYDYTRECNGCTNSLQAGEAYGYWTRDLISNTAYAWFADRYGCLNDDTVSISTHHGVRPVITVLKTNLYSE